MGDRLVNLRGESVVVQDIRRRPVPEAVYNFSVAGLHTYFVGQGGIWVHNNSGAGCAVPGAAAKTTGTVWDSVKATQPLYEGTAIPRSFELATGNGKVWVHGNATEHMAEYATSMLNRGVSPSMVNMGTQAQITSLQSAVNAATANGVQYGKLLNVGGWELKFGAPQQAGQLPALIHALPH